MGNLDRDKYLSGTEWSNMEKIRLSVDDWDNTDIGLTNAILSQAIATAKSTGVCGAGFDLIPNPSGTPNQVEVGVGYVLHGDGEALVLEAPVTLTVLNGDAGKFIVAKKEIKEINPRTDLYLGSTTTTARETEIEIVLESTPVAEDTILGKIEEVNAGIVTVSIDDREYYNPNAGPAGVDLDRIAATPAIDEDDMLSLPFDPVDAVDELNKIKTVINVIVHGGDAIPGEWWNVLPIPPLLPSNIQVSTGMENIFMYNDLNILSRNHSNLAYASITWDAPSGAPTPHYYEVALVPLQKVALVDVELTVGTILRDTRVSSNLALGTTGSTDTVAIFRNLTPRIKYRIKIRSIRETSFGIFKSDWIDGPVFYTGGDVAGLVDPGGLSLNITGTYRGFILSWDEVPGALEYVIYAKAGSTPEITNPDDRIAVVEGTKYLANWPYTTDSVYFRVLAITPSGIQSSWYLSGSATMLTASDTPTTATQVAALDDETNMVASLRAFLDEHGVNTVTQAMQNYGKVTEILIPVIHRDGLKPKNISSSMSTEKHGVWLCPSDKFRIHRIWAVPFDTSAGFTSTTYVDIYINNTLKEDLSLELTGYAAIQKFDTSDFTRQPLNPSDIIHMFVYHNGDANLICCGVDVVPYYPVTT